MPINTPSSLYTEQEKKRRLPRALMGGTVAMREAGKEFTPQHPAETDESYKVRLASTTLFNAFKDTVKKMTGKVFSKNVIIGEDVPPQIAELMENVDGQGRNLTTFCLDGFEEGMVDGIAFIFVDFPQVTSETGAPTMADQQAIGARPNSVLICAGNLIDWDHENRGGQEFLTEVRITEKVIEQDPSDKYIEKTINQIRVLRPGEYEIWRQEGVAGSLGSWKIYENGTTSLDYIPLIPIYINRTGYFSGEPPLEPLAELNLEHWISSSEQRKALTFARFAMLVLAGVDEKSTVEVGPDKVLKIPLGATASYAETNGSAIAAGQTDLEAIEKKMQHAGMTIQVQNQQGNVTATQASIGDFESNSALLAASGSMEDAINNMLQVFADYMGLENGGTVTINKEFGKKPAQGTVGELSTLYTTGILSGNTVREELKRRGTIDESVDVEAEQEMVASEALNLMGTQTETATVPVKNEQSAQSTVQSQPDMTAITEAINNSAKQQQDMLNQIMAAITHTKPVQDTSTADAIAAMGASNKEMNDAIIAKLGQPVEAPVVNVAAPVVNVPAPVINMPEQPAPTINIAPAAVNIAPAAITVNMPEQPPANVTVNNVDGKKTIEIKRDAEGNIISGSVQ